jgi:hypothetical protein
MSLTLQSFTGPVYSWSYLSNDDAKMEGNPVLELIAGDRPIFDLFGADGFHTDPNQPERRIYGRFALTVESEGQPGFSGEGLLVRDVWGLGDISENFITGKDKIQLQTPLSRLFGFGEVNEDTDRREYGEWTITLERLPDLGPVSYEPLSEEAAHEEQVGRGIEEEVRLENAHCPTCSCR